MQLVLKQDTNTFMLTPTYEESDYSEDQTVCLNLNLTQSATEKEHIVNIKALWYQNRTVTTSSSLAALMKTDSQDSKEDKHGVSAFCPKTKCHSNTVCKIHLNTDTKFFHDTKVHLRTHTGKKLYNCVAPVAKDTVE